MVPLRRSLPQVYSLKATPHTPRSRIDDFATDPSLLVARTAYRHARCVLTLLRAMHWQGPSVVYD
eukprot:6132685-Prymnesium_polylepis.1